MADGGEVDAQLMRAPRGGQQPQQGEILAGGECLICRAGGQAVRVDFPPQDGRRVAPDGERDLPCGRLRLPQTDPAVLTVKISRVQQCHAPRVHVPRLGDDHRAGGAAVEPVHAVKAVLPEIVDDRARDGDRLLRQRGGVQCSVRYCTFT